MSAEQDILSMFDEMVREACFCECNHLATQARRIAQYWHGQDYDADAIRCLEEAQDTIAGILQKVSRNADAT